VHAALEHHAEVEDGRKPRYKAPDTGLSPPRRPNDLWCTDYKGELQRRVHARRSRLLLPAQITDRQPLSASVFARQNAGAKQVDERIWLVSFMQYELGFFDDDTCRLEPAQNPSVAGERVTHVSGWQGRTRRRCGASAENRDDQRARPRLGREDRRIRPMQSSAESP
jgi:hypothetical protein